MDAEETWNSIYVEGPQSEIDRLKVLCALKDIQEPTEDIVVNFSQLIPGYGYMAFGTWNLVTHGPHKPDTFSFGFDNPGGCLVEIFERLAEEFPSLAFYFSCIGSHDEFLASGCLNGPPGDEKFAFSDVPDDYWGPKDRSDDD